MARKTDTKIVSTLPTQSAAQQTAGQMAVLPTTGQGEFLLYQTEDAQTRVQVRFEAGDVWLTQQQLADLYQSSPQNITQHIRAIYQTGELQEAATCKPYLQVRQERGRQVSRSLKHYNLEVALDVAKLLPAPGNAAASEAFAKNIFSVTRQVRYSTLMRNTRCGARSPSPPAPRRNDTKRCERPRPTRPPGAEYFFVIRVM